MKYLVFTGILIFVISFFLYTIPYWTFIFPKSHFNNSITYARFHIFSDTIIDESVKGVLDEVELELADIPGFKENEYEIFLCNSESKFKYFADKVHRPYSIQGFNLEPLNYIFINLTYIEKIKTRYGEKFKFSILEGSIKHIISHEICHELITDQIGFLQMRNSESWKLEGFCEYAASRYRKSKDKDYNFFKTVETYFKYEQYDIAPGRQFYLESEFAVEYYLNFTDNRNFVTLFEEKINKDSILSALKQKVYN